MIVERIDTVEPTSEEAMLHVNVLSYDIGTVKYQSRAQHFSRPSLKQLRAIHQRHQLHELITAQNDHVQVNRQYNSISMDV